MVALMRMRLIVYYCYRGTYHCYAAHISFFLPSDIRTSVLGHYRPDNGTTLSFRYKVENFPKNIFYLATLLDACCEPLKSRESQFKTTDFKRTHL